MTEGMKRSGCPVTGFESDCHEACEWFIDPEEKIPRGGCVLVLLFRELIALRIPRKRVQA